MISSAAPVAFASSNFSFRVSKSCVAAANRQLRANAASCRSLNACAELGLMAGNQAERLREAYQFLRILENRLQP